uniref:Spen paralogue and orthologue SPOC C-terminal domain-containing protein n=1 Tax=Aegilops tauschii TaxID=37682 RepID=R7W0C3_AEGTA
MEPAGELIMRPPSRAAAPASKPRDNANCPLDNAQTVTVLVLKILFSYIDYLSLVLQIIDSYTADETVGIVKPAQGITLYLCPSQGKAAQILADHLPKEHLGQPIGALLQDDRNSNKVDKANSANLPKTMNMAAVSEFQIHSEDVPSQQSYCESKLESPMNKPASVLDPVEEPKGDVLAKSSPQMVDAEESRTVNGLTTESSMQCKITPDVSLTRHSIWEATIQHESSRTNIVVIFKSGEKPSTHQWHRFLRIEGRVRLSALKEFLIELLKSRSRTILVTELRWKEGSLESGRHHLLKTIDSYTANETVGLVKPAQGITLYLCPSQGKAAQILADHLPKEHLRSLTVSRTSIIGVVVWQRPHASSRVPSWQDFSKRQATISSSSPMISKPSSRSSNASYQEVVAADVPPGVGSRVVRHQDGLPAEYNLVSVSNSAADVTRTQSYKSHQLPVHTSNDTRIEEIIRKYDKTHSQGNLQQERIQQPHYPYQQYHQQLQHHSMRQYHMARNSHSPLAYTQHQNTAMPVRGRPLIYGHPMQPAQQSYSGVPDDGSQTHVTRAWYLQ